MQIDYINGPKTDKIFGMSKYQMEIERRLNIELNLIEYNSLMRYFDKRYQNHSKNKSDTHNKSLIWEKSLNLISNLGKKTLRSIDQQRYIHKVNTAIKKENIKHITTQEYAYVQNSLEMEKTIITCHDLIPWVYENDHSNFWKSNISGLKKADTIITVSEFSKNDIVKHLDYPSENVHVVKDAVDHSRYYVDRNKEILDTLKISAQQKVILYVGSETPRQNVPVLIKAFARLKNKIPDIKLVKIGESQSYGARANILKLISELKLDEDVFFVGYVSEKDMPKWYNAADILVYPCKYAGFGLPPLEAMACGTPVITANTTSLPEVVGDAGIMVDPDDYKVIGEEMYKILTNEKLREEFIKKGIRRSKLFNWNTSAQQTFDIYNSF